MIMRAQSGLRLREFYVQRRKRHRHTDTQTNRNTETQTHTDTQTRVERDLHRDWLRNDPSLGPDSNKSVTAERALYMPMLAEHLEIQYAVLGLHVEHIRCQYAACGIQSPVSGMSLFESAHVPYSDFRRLYYFMTQ